jgi:hypothetical protein
MQDGRSAVCVRERRAAQSIVGRFRMRQLREHAFFFGIDTLRFLRLSLGEFVENTTELVPIISIGLAFDRGDSPRGTDFFQLLLKVRILELGTEREQPSLAKLGILFAEFREIESTLFEAFLAALAQL